MRAWAPTGTTLVCVRAILPPVRVRGGTTSSVVPPRARTGGQTVQLWMRVAPIGAHVCVRFKL